ncbi:DUF6457 domain-containing protein [Arthrobacter sp. ZGTC131]|uniref:DUF6457 domain-containing protein n=1 Tax=Arthrobacter sp. ZGTC131 TaxID=2058898 RepID=UPI000CE31C80|nr:DUF6457 domain-containing protein [Arthrobacter sp. ZGTC131]
MPTNDEELQILNEWSQELAQALQIPDLPIDHEILLDLARKSADTITHAAAPVTAFLVGYAAGSRGLDASDSLASTAGVASSLCESHNRRPHAGE